MTKRDTHLPPNKAPEFTWVLAAKAEHEESALDIDARALRRRVLGLAGPVIGENFLQTLLGIIDTLLVARLGAAAIAGVGSALQVMMFLIMGHPRTGPYRQAAAGAYDVVVRAGKVYRGRSQRRINRYDH